MKLPTMSTYQSPTNYISRYNILVIKASAVQYEFSPNRTECQCEIIDPEGKAVIGTTKNMLLSEDGAIGIGSALVV